MLWLISAACIAASLNPAQALAGYRLPDNLKPVHYALDLVSDLEEFKFNGEVRIKINCVKPTSSIVLHSLKLKIADNVATIKEINGDGEEVGSSLKITQQKSVPENEFYIFKLDQTLKATKQYLLTIPFSGEISNGLEGYYRSKYFDKNANQTKWLGVTQFEAADARRAFPCFDEPEFKARFTIKLAHKDNLKAASNMPLVKTTPMNDRPGWVWDEFEESVPMSTYLVAWLVSDFEYGESEPRPNNIKFRIWARSEAIDQISFAKDIGPKILEYYEELFDTKYPLPKQDMVAIPDFSAGAMENWGLITYRESALLYDPKASTIYNKERVAEVIAHELAHQWFGNLVTMKWWTDLWLNEGFATYIASLGVNKIFPEWNHLKGETLSNLRAVYNLDSLKSSHPISVEIGHPSEVREIFDAISYKKGSSVIRMMHNFLGKSFETGVANYLKAHKFGNAEQDNLWGALTEQAHKDGVFPQEMTVKEIMDTWTLQTGYPLITVKRNYEKGTATISQKRFLKIMPEGRDDSNGTCWRVPISYTTQSESNFNATMPKAWLKCGEDLEIQGLPGDNEWVIFNIGLTAVMKIQYDPKNFDLIVKTLNSENYKTIDTLNRAGLLMDAFDLAERGDITYESAFKLASYLPRETEFLPISTGLTALKSVGSRMRRTPNYGLYQAYVRQIIRPLYERYNSLTDIPTSMEDIKLHELISSWACSYEVGNCVEQVKSLFQKWADTKDLDNENPIPTDLRPIVFCNAVRYGGTDVWDKLWERYKVSNYASEKNTIFYALTCSRDVWILNRYLEWSIDPKSDVRKQDSSALFSSVARSDTGYYVAWDFLQRRIKDIYKYHQPRGDIMGKYLTVYSEKVIYDDEVDKLKDFISRNKDYFKQTKLVTKQSLEKAVANAKWHSKYYSTISDLLRT